MKKEYNEIILQNLYVHQCAEHANIILDYIPCCSHLNCHEHQILDNKVGICVSVVQCSSTHLRCVCCEDICDICRIKICTLCSFDCNDCCRLVCYNCVNICSCFSTLKTTLNGINL